MALMPIYSNDIFLCHGRRPSLDRFSQTMNGIKQHSDYTSTHKWSMSKSIEHYLWTWHKFCKGNCYLLGSLAAGITVIVNVKDHQLFACCHKMTAFPVIPLTAFRWSHELLLVALRMKGKKDLFDRRPVQDLNILSLVRNNHFPSRNYKCDVNCNSEFCICKCCPLFMLLLLLFRVWAYPKVMHSILNPLYLAVWIRKQGKGWWMDLSGLLIAK